MRILLFLVEAPSEPIGISGDPRAVIGRQSFAVRCVNLSRATLRSNEAIRMDTRITTNAMAFQTWSRANK